MLALSKLEEFADDKTHVSKKIISFFDRLDSTMGKGFLDSIIGKGFFPRVVQSWQSVVEGSIYNSWSPDSYRPIPSFNPLPDDKF